MELRQELDSVIGQKLDHSVLERLAARIRHDLRVQNVAVRVRRGEVPGSCDGRVRSSKRHAGRISMSMSRSLPTIRGRAGAGSRKPPPPSATPR